MEEEGRDVQKQKTRYPNRKHKTQKSGEVTNMN